MTERGKKILKGVGITVGILLIIGVGVMIYYKSTRSDDENEDENPYTKPSQPKSSSPKSTSSLSFSVEEIKGMQSWLWSSAIVSQNKIITAAINDTGGIDGKIGPGFIKAENEAIRVGLIKDRRDLFAKSKK